MRTVIIDDEPYLREMLRELLTTSFDEIEIVGEADNVTDGVRVINEQKPALVLLDIEIKGGKGFDILEKVTYEAFRVIFVTAYDSFALKAIKFSALDYILKPLDEEELTTAVRKALAEREKPLLQEQIENFFHNCNDQQNKKLVLRTAGDIHILNVREIIRCESDNSYTTFFLENGEEIVVSRGIKEYDDLLKDHGFIRPHRSHLVNLDHVRRLDKSDGGFLILKNGKEIPVSARRKQSLLQILDEL